MAERRSPNLAGWLACLLTATTAAHAAPNRFDPIGSYVTESPGGKPLGVHYCVPPGSGPDTPILIVIPGARRNAAEYRDQWADLATSNGLIVLTLEATQEHYPTEYDYNAGGVLDSNRRVRPASEWLFSAIEPLFEEFRERYGSSRAGYLLYGHSAGGGFVHRFLLMKPGARVERAVAANPAFCAYPTRDLEYPFGLGGLPLAEGATETWFAKPLVILLGDRDLNPRTKPLSNGPQARRQGPHVLARGVGLYHKALKAADRLGPALRWKLEVVHGVGHSNTHMASYAVRHLLKE